MLNLTKEERIVVIFFAACFLIGSGVNFYKKKIAVIASPDEVGAKQYQKEIAKININTAGFRELIKIKGIGEKTAINILDYRKENGSFFYKEDLMKVKGIGKAKFDSIRKSIITE